MESLAAGGRLAPSCPRRCPPLAFAAVFFLLPAWSAEIERAAP